MQVPASNETAAELRLAITRAARRLRQEAQGGLTMSRMVVLSTVASEGPLTTTQIAEREGIKKPSVTRIVRALEREQLVEREDDPHDGRSFLIRATPKALDLLGAARSRKEAELGRWIEQLSDEEHLALSRATEIISRVLDEDAAETR